MACDSSNDLIRRSLVNWEETLMREKMSRVLMLMLNVIKPIAMKEPMMVERICIQFGDCFLNRLTPNGGNSIKINPDTQWCNWVMDFLSGWNKRRMVALWLKLSWGLEISSECGDRRWLFWCLIWFYFIHSVRIVFVFATQIFNGESFNLYWMNSFSDLLEAADVCVKDLSVFGVQFNFHRLCVIIIIWTFVCWVKPAPDLRERNPIWFSPFGCGKQRISIF